MSLKTTAIQLYTSARDNVGKPITAADAVAFIKDTTNLQHTITKLRDLQQTLHNEKENYKDQEHNDSVLALYKKFDAQIAHTKTGLPAVTWSGTFKKRSAKLLIQHSGLICLDIDKLTDTKKHTLLQKFEADKYTHICFTSPSGNGIKVVVKVAAAADTHKDYFASLEAYYKKNFDVEIDKSGKDVSRLCFLTADENIFVNDSSISFPLALQTEIPQPEQQKASKLTKQQGAELTATSEDLYSVIAFTDVKMTYKDGNHNNYIMLFACNANRKGFSLTETLSFSVLHFNNKPQTEVEATVKSAYATNSHEHGKYKKTSKLSKPGANDFKNNTKAKTQQHITPAAAEQIQGKPPVAGSGSSNTFKPFWKHVSFTKGKGDDAYQVERIIFSRVDFSDFLFSEGFHLLKTGKEGYQLCHSAAGIIKPVTPQQIKQYVLSWCRDKDLREVEEMLRQGQKQYFAINELDSLPFKEIEFKKDTAAASYFYFKNCWVTVTAEGITKHNYSELDTFIWEGNKIDADYEIQMQNFANEKLEIDPAVMTCEFAKFLAYISYNPKNIEEKEFTPLQKLDRFESILTSYGYLLDGYKHAAKRKAIFAVDHKIGDKDEQNGRTGKSIIPKAASYLKVVSPINGKSFNPQYQFKYEPITMDSQIVNFNDMPRNFDVETIFEVIADDYSVTRRNNGYINFTYYDSPKVFVSTNFTPKGQGASYTGRMHIIEASDYFNDTHSPYEEFGHALFTDWSPQQWNMFYNTSLWAVMLYKQRGLVNYPDGNFDVRKLVNEVAVEFIDFMDSDSVFRNVKIEKLKVFEVFNNDYYFPANGKRLSANMFNRWIKQYCKNKGLRFNPHKNGAADKSNGKEYYILADDNYNEAQTKLL